MEMEVQYPPSVNNGEWMSRFTLQLRSLMASDCWDSPYNFRHWWRVNVLIHRTAPPSLMTSECRYLLYSFHQWWWTKVEIYYTTFSAGGEWMSIFIIHLPSLTVVNVKIYYTTLMTDGGWKSRLNKRLSCLLCTQMKCSLIQGALITDSVTACKVCGEVRLI